MRRKVELIIGLLVLIGMIAAAGRLSSYVSGSSVKKGEVQVILDPGHGGRDPGKVGVNDTLEKDINLQIAKKVAVILEDKGISVAMTRTDDNGLYSENVTNKKADDMKKRVKLINDVQPELTVSIHQNSYTDGKIRGAQVFYYADSKMSEQIAGIMSDCLKDLDAEHIRQPKADTTYYMLKKTKVPTVIVECGFLSNAVEEENLNKEDYQDQLAQSICEGIIKSLTLLEP